jgi:signal peptidase I
VTVRLSQPVRKVSKEHSPDAPYSAETQKSAVREYIEAFVVALLLAIVLRTFFIQAYKIPSGSMEPTLLVGDHIIVNKLDYGFRLPDSFFGLTPFAGEVPYGKYLFQLEPVRRGDVAVFVFPGDTTKDFIKRVVAVPGDTVQVKAGILYINGVQVPDPHAHFDKSAAERLANSPADYMGPLKLQANQYFMMGDNRDHSYDSRFWGPVTRDAIEGRAMFIYWSCADDTSALSCFYDVRWSRIFKVVH